MTTLVIAIAQIVSAETASHAACRLWAVENFSGASDSGTSAPSAPSDSRTAAIDPAPSSTRALGSPCDRSTRARTCRVSLRANTREGSGSTDPRGGPWQTPSAQNDPTGPDAQSA